MAEGLFRAALRQQSLSDQEVSVGSAGVAAMPGQVMSLETEEILNDQDASIDGFRSREVNGELVNDADLIIAMTGSHADVLCRYFPRHAKKVYLMGDFIDENEPVAGREIPDPIGMGKEAYVEVAEVMELAIPSILISLLENDTKK